MAVTETKGVGEMKKTPKNAILLLSPFLIVALFLASLYVWGAMAIIVIVGVAVVAMSYITLWGIGKIIVDYYGDK